MPLISQVILPRSPALERRLKALVELPRSDAFATFRRAVRTAVVEGHQDGMLAGTDGRGRPLAPLAPATLKGRKGTGPPLVPRGLQSRFIRNFRADWYKQDDRSWDLERRFAGIQTKAGAPFAQYHLTGASRITSRGNLWVLPKRDVSQIRPGTWAKIKALHATVLKSIQ